MAKSLENISMELTLSLLFECKLWELQAFSILFNGLLMIKNPQLR